MSARQFTFDESELLPISALQHYVFCRRQFALIHLEGLWHENVLTAEGRVMHEKVHDSQKSGYENGVYVMRSLPLKSLQLGVYGIADVVEFKKTDTGIELVGMEGKYIPYPIEYKRGRSKVNDCDRIQLCAQAICLEEMLECHIEMASIFYGEPRRRENVILNDELRNKTKNMCCEIRQLYKSGITQKPVYTSSCKRCSLLQQCSPKSVQMSVNRYWSSLLLLLEDEIP